MHYGLTSFRAFAFISVFLYHSSDFVFDAGYLGVQAFFVLSGFLLTPILLQMKRNLPTRQYFLHFYGRRSIRVFPLYYLFLVMITVLSLLIVCYGVESRELDHFFSSIKWSYTYTLNFYHTLKYAEHSKLVSHFWSLAVEEQYYLIWPILLALVDERSIKKLLVCCIIMGPVIRYFTEIVVYSNSVPFLSDKADVVVYVLSFSHIDAFSIGGLFSLYGKKISEYYVWIAIVITVFAGFLTEYILTDSVYWSGLGYYPFMSEKFIWGYSVINALFAFIISQVRYDAFASRLFNNPVAHYLGMISYGLYVFHFPLLWLVPVLMPKHSIPYANDVIAFCLTVAISSISYHGFESKLIVFKDHYFPKNLTDRSEESVHAS